MVDDGIGTNDRTGRGAVPLLGVALAALHRQASITAFLARWIVLGAASGTLAGLASWVFLEGLDRVTEFRLDHGWLVWLLPLGGLAIGALYHLVGGRAARGNALLIEEIHEPTEWVPRRMAPLVLGGTWLTHLFGGSAGREGTALQMSGSLTDLLSRTLRLRDEDRRLLLIAALGGGFGAVFGVPLAGAVFAMEVQAVGRVRYEALVPALTASVVGDLVVSGLGYEHAPLLQIETRLGPGVALKVAVAGLAFGLASVAFIEAIHAVSALAKRFVSWPPLRPALGGVALIALIALCGRDYLGLSLPLSKDALAGLDVAGYVFALKLLFTAITLGTGFPGGEVTPLFVIGATLGASLSGLLDVPPHVLAAIGFVAVFAAASNTPLACTVMGAEMFGASAIPLIAIGCVVAYVFSSHRSIYATQRVAAAKHR